MTLTFSVHIFAYYSPTAWLPTYLAGAGGMGATQAGIVASLFQIFSLTGSLGIPLLARRILVETLMVAITLVLIPLGLILARMERGQIEGTTIPDRIT